MLSVVLLNSIFILTLIFFISWLFIALVVYFIPLIIAKIRRHNNIVAIAILNTVLGWTFFGWLAALLWSLNSDTNEEEKIEDD